MNFENQQKPEEKLLIRKMNKRKRFSQLFTFIVFVLGILKKCSSF